MATVSYEGNTASGSARQHNGNVYNYNTYNYNLRQRRSDETLRPEGLNEALLKASAEGQTKRVEHLLRLGAEPDHVDASGMSALHQASISGFVDTVEALLALNVDVNTNSEVYGSPLCLAAIKGRSQVVEALLDARADPNAPGGHLGSPLHAACYNNDVALVGMLVERGANVTAVRKIVNSTVAKLISIDVPDRWIFAQPLYVAVSMGHLEVVRFLIERNANCCATHDVWEPEDEESNGVSEAELTARKEQHHTGISALMAAAAIGHVGIFTHLVNCGAEVYAQDSFDYGIIGFAAKGGASQCLQLALELTPKSVAKTASIEAAVYFAASNGHVDLLRLLRDDGHDMDAMSWEMTPLYAACRENHPRCASLLLRCRAKAEAICERRRRPLHAASLAGSTDILDVLFEGRPQLKVDPRDEDGETPLMLAASEGHLDFIIALLNKDADIDKSNDQGETALMLAAGQGRNDCVNLLIESGAKLNATDDDGWTALRHAIEDQAQTCVESLLEAGAKVNIRDQEGKTILMAAAAEDNATILSALVEEGANIKATTKETGETALMVAAANNCTRNVEILLEADVEIMTANIDGDTALHYAAIHGSTESLKAILERIPVEQRLSSPKKWLDKKNKNSMSALAEAVKEGHVDCIEALAKAGADLNTRVSSIPLTAWATGMRCKIEVIEKLIELGASASTLGMKLSTIAKAGKHIDLAEALQRREQAKKEEKQKDKKSGGLFSRFKR